MNYLELDNNTDTYRVYKYRGKILKRTRNANTGNYSNLYTQYLTPFAQQTLKENFGGNGDVSNINASFLLKFPNAKFSDISQNTALKGQMLSVFKLQDSTSVLSTLKFDTSASNENELSIYINISWGSSDGSAETKANALITAVKDSTKLTSMFATLLVPSPFNVVQLDLSLDAITVNAFATSTINSLVAKYNSEPNNTDIEVKTIGLYDHIGVKINSEDDNSYRRLRTNSVKTININGINPLYDIIIATLFDKDYKKLYTSIQTPIMFVQQTSGKSGDLLSKSANGSITLNLNVNDFITNNQADFITTMNKQTGGYTVVINVFSGSAIVKYQILFDVTKTQEQINNVITILNSDTAIQAVINTSSTMNGVTSTKTPGTTSVQVNDVLTPTSAVIGAKYNALNQQIEFNTIGAYQNILYKATGQTTFMITTNKSVDKPIGLTNNIDVKLVDINGNDLTTVVTFTVDIVSPVIVLIGDNPKFIPTGIPYIELGATVTDNSGETLTASITGTVNVNTPGSYVISYNAVDSCGNVAIQVQRTVNVNQPIKPEFIPFNTSTINYTYGNGNNVIVADNNITLVNGGSWFPKTSYLATNYNFNTNYNAPWRVIFKVKINLNNIIGIGWDSPQTSWGKPSYTGSGGGYTGSAPCALYFFSGGGSFDAGTAASNLFTLTVNSGVGPAILEGCIFIIDYDNSYKLSVSVVNLRGVVVYNAITKLPYTYVNKIETFHFYNNWGNAIMYGGMIYDSTRTATYQTLLNNI